MSSVRLIGLDVHKDSVVAAVAEAGSPLIPPDETSEHWATSGVSVDVVLRVELPRLTTVNRAMTKNSISANLRNLWIKSL